MRENRPFPDPIDLKGKGYQQFPLPHNNEDFVEEFRLIQASLLVALDEFNLFKETQKPDSAMLSLDSFCKLIAYLERSMASPADVARVISNDDFFRDFSKIVTGIRELRVIECAEQYVQDKEAASQLPHFLLLDARNTLKQAREMLLRAEIYLASRLDKNSKHD